MMINNPTGYNTIIQADDYIAEKITEYIETIQNEKVIYKNSQFNFSINTFDSKSIKLKGNYDDFYSYIDLKREENIIVSPNEEKIKAFCGYINRLTN